MASVIDDITIPDERGAAEAGTAAATLDRYLRTHPTGGGRVKLGVAAETEVEVPAEALRLLVEILGHLARGNAVTVAPLAAEITSQQAAELLNVSRPFVVKLLEDGQLPFRKVGNRRRVRLVDVLAYRRRDDEHRELVLRQLADESQALGLYEQRRRHPLIAVYDACVLHDPALRDLLIRLARKPGLDIQAKWSEQILDEMVRSIAGRRPDLTLPGSSGPAG